MNRTSKLLLSLALFALASNAYAGNDNGPSFFGDTTNNNQTYNQPVAHGGAGGQGGDAAAAASAVANGGTAFGGAGGSVGDIRNTASGGNASLIGSGNSHNTNLNTALGGEGDKGGDANQAQAQKQGQDQAQKQAQQSSTSTSTSTSTAQQQSTDASSQNDNRSTAAGNTTAVGGQQVNISSSYVAKRNAPGAYAPSVYPTATCQKSVSFGLSNLWGGGSAGFSYADQECQTVVLAQNLASIGMTDTACDVLTTSGAWARAVAAKPELAKVSCRIAKEAAVIEQAVTPAVSPWKYHTVIEGAVKQ